MICQRATSLEQIKEKFDKVPFEYKNFPTMQEFGQMFPKKRRYIATRNNLLWESLVPGTPAAVEALFKCIQEGRTETGAFKWGLNYCRLSEEKLFEAYEMYLKGQVHEDIKWLNRRRFGIG